MTKQLRKEYYADHDNVAVKDLFGEAAGLNNQCKCTYFSVRDVPNELLEYLYIMDNQNRNHLFRSCWKIQCKQYINLSTFKEVHEKVCVVVLDECKEILLSLRKRTMTLENVDIYFPKFQPTELESHLNKLCQGIRQCFREDRELLPAKVWVHGVIVHIQEYMQIKNYLKVAMVVLELKKSMKLNGDFTVIKTLAQQVLADYS